MNPEQGKWKEWEEGRRKWIWVLGSLSLLALVSMLGLAIANTLQLQRQEEYSTASKLYREIDFQFPVGSASEDEVIRLPSARYKPNFRHYSGYLQADDERNRFWHYWLVESQSDPSRDPLVLWLNGGPGCSSLMGLLTELGPFRINQDSEVQENPHAWNKLANLIFIESPAGVGFSYASNGSIDSDDDTTAEQNYKALRSFFEKFPHFKNRSLYLAGESYASVYLVTLGVLLDQDKEVNLRGVAIGNGCLEGLQLKESLIFFSYYRGLIGEEIWNNFSQLCCNGKPPSRKDCKFRAINEETSNGGEVLQQDCQELMEDTALYVLDGGLNLYNLNANCAYPGRQKTSKVLEHYRPPCYNNTLTINYLNKAEVRLALHVPSNFSYNFIICNRKINYTKIYTDKANGLNGHFQRLLESPRRLRLLIYNGDNDLLCNHLGDDWFVKNLNQTLIGKHRAWFLNDQVAGFSKRYHGITFATVKGAGHMVPADRPIESLHLFHHFINETSPMFMFNHMKSSKL